MSRAITASRPASSAGRATRTSVMPIWLVPSATSGLTHTHSTRATDTAVRPASTRKSFWRSGTRAGDEAHDAEAEQRIGAQGEEAEPEGVAGREGREAGGAVGPLPPTTSRAIPPPMNHHGSMRPTFGGRSSPRRYSQMPATTATRVMIPAV